jgi:hypothetical protein
MNCLYISYTLVDDFSLTPQITFGKSSKRDKLTPVIILSGEYPK